MGFYAPAQLVADARRHGVAVRPADVTVSNWDCTLEQMDDGEPAVRLGLRLVTGLSRAGADRLIKERMQAPFADATDLARRAQLSRRDLQALAAADALKTLSGHRHRARWAVAGIEPVTPLLAEAPMREGLPLLRSPTEGESIVADYANLGLTLGRHPLALLRDRLARASLLSAAEVHDAVHGRFVRTGGLVICRQHPSSGNGVIFITLEDETGQVNLIVWPSVAERDRRALLNARFMTVAGEVQREGEVLHVIAKKLEDHSRLLGRLITQSRDFH